ncbi:MAG: haloacid dehalogenase type II [Desulfuromonadales bacterium]|jgi:2-haloacid dehalogenase
MSLTIAFDVYGTLIDTAGVVTALEELIGDRARTFSDLWRSKQLEYSYRRGLMQNYRDFSVCTAQALDFCCAALQVQIGARDRTALLAGYRVLPAFADTGPALAAFQDRGCRCFAFSNGKPDDVQNLLEQAGLLSSLTGVISTDEIKSFKPNPAVYAHFLRRSQAAATSVWLVSGNPFDVIGAISAGLQGAWVRRAPEAVFDPWEIQPTVIVEDLVQLCNVLIPRQ